VVLVMALAIGVAARAAAQDRIDRTPFGGRDPRGETQAQRLVMGMGQPASPLAWTVYPSASGRSGTYSSGVSLIGARKFGDSTTFAAAASLKRVSGNGSAATRVGASAQVTPAILGRLHKALSLTLSGDFVSTEGAGSSQEYSASVDAEGELGSIGVVAAYGRTSPSGGTSTGGGFAGATAALNVASSTVVSAEYYIDTEYTGEDTFLARLSQVLRKADPAVTLVAGAQKHKVFFAGLKVRL
jgi:hypothetical protein